MSEAVALSGTDTLIINDIVQSGLADGDFAVFDFPDDIAQIKVAKDGNMLVALSQKGNLADVTFRYIRGTTDDKTFNALVASFQANPSGFTLMQGEFIKKIGAGDGSNISDNYVFSSGVPSKLQPVKGNADGEPDQGVSVYKMKCKCARIIT